MISPRTRFKKIGILCGLLMCALVGIYLVRRNEPSISVLYVGIEETSRGPSHLFVISNSLPYRVNWVTLEPEFKLHSGWTTSKPPEIPGGGRSRPGNPEPLRPGGNQKVFASYPTNVAHRLPVMWEIYDEDAESRPNWKRVTDAWAERKFKQPLFLPRGIARSQVVPAGSADRIPGEKANAVLERTNAGSTSQVVDQQLSSAKQVNVASSPTFTRRVIFEGPTSLESWIQGRATANKESGAWSYNNGALVSTTVGAITPDVQLPTVASVEFDLAWSNALYLGLALYADSPQPLDLTSEDRPPIEGFYSVQFNGEMANVFAVSQGEPMRSLGMVTVPGMRDKSSVQVNILIHKPDSRLWLYMDDMLIKQWEDSRKTLGKGRYLRFVNPAGSRLKISNVVISEWDGKTNENFD